MRTRSKNTAAVVLISVWMLGCGGIRLTTWQVSDSEPQHGVFVFARFAEVAARTNVEMSIAHVFEERGLRAIPSLSLLPPADADLERVFETGAEQAGASAILVVRPLGLDESFGTDADTVRVFSDHFYGWAEEQREHAISRRRDLMGTVVRVEASLYPLETMRLVWRAESEPVEYARAHGSAAELAVALVEALEKDGILVP